MPPQGGQFAIGANRFWHGGVHLHGANVPIRAVADGELIAYRINKTLVESDLGDGQPARKHSTGVAVLRHVIETPLGSQIRFFSIYAHLLPVTEDQTKEESVDSQEAWVFKKTQWMVAGTSHGSGLPVVDAECRVLNGIIPFGGRFKVLAPDAKTQAETFRKVSVVVDRLAGIVAVNENALTAKAPSKQSRQSGE